MIKKPDNYNISSDKYEKALVAIIQGVHTQVGVADAAGINRTTAAKIMKDPVTHEIIRENSENKIKNASSDMVDNLMDLAKNSSRDDIKIDAIKHILALGGISPTSRHEVSTEIKGTGQLDSILDQISNHKINVGSSLEDEDDV